MQSRRLLDVVAAPWSAVLALAALAFASRLLASLTTDEALGPDGYYYAVQARSLLEEGAFHVRDGSWALYALTAAGWATGNIVVGIKIGCALFAALIVPAGYLLGGALGRGDDRGHLRGLTIAAWAAASPSLSYLAAGHGKNLVALAPLVAGAALLVSPRSRPRAVGGGALLLFAALAHKVVAAVVLGGLLIAGAGAALKSDRRRQLHAHRLPLAALFVVVLALFVAASALLPNLLHPSDFARVRGQVGLDGEGPLPFGFFGDRQVPTVLVAEMALSWLALVVVVAARRRLFCAHPVVWAAALLLLVILAVPWRTDVVDLGFRLGLLTPLLAAVVLAFGWPKGPMSLGAERALCAGWGAAALLLAPLLASRAMNLDEQPPYPRYRELIAALPRPLPPLVIAHHGLSFLYDWETGAEAMAWAPEPELDPHEVGRIVYGITPPEVRDFHDDVDPSAAERVRPLRGLYAYTTEAGWRRLLAWAEESDPGLHLRLLDERNPRRARPAMLLRNRPEE